MEFGCHITWLFALIPACLATTPWECTYRYGLGLETKTCSSGCCKHDCCTSGTGAGVLFGGLAGAVLFVILVATCCAICCCRLHRRRQNAAMLESGAPMQATNTTTAPVVVPVPEHYGYEQPNIQPSGFGNFVARFDFFAE